ncbi:phosphodiesterase [Oceanibium sediminis]|uniref:phosphodiesterase n=1 Tax=Oceanibium sediminis TaxID=2026339 RepID=UPI000DD3C532|nr:phosphodiesterase [Oceanibium sediminis]
MARFLQLTDLHVVTRGALASGVLDTRALLRAAIDRLVARLDALGPLDAVLLTGDISDDGSPDSYAFARAELDRLQLPLLAIPGNHDAREPMRAAFADTPGMPGSGLVDWTVDLAGTRVIGLDTLVEGQGGGRLRAESLALLADALDWPGPVVVALHHPPLHTGIKFMDAIGLENTPALETVLGSAQADVTVIAGHVHGVYHGRIGQHAVATAPAICSAFALDRRDSATVGFLTGPTGCAVIDTAPGGVWSALPLDPAEGPYPF